MRKIIFFGKSKRRTRTTFHIVRAFRERGNQVLWLNPAGIRRRQKKHSEQWIQNQVESFQPDIIFIYSRDIPPGILRQVSTGGIKTVLYYEDMSSEISSSLIHLGRQVDFFLATNSGLIEDYRRAGVANPIYFTGACDRYDHRPRRPFLPIWKSDIAFIGRARPNETRVSLTRKLNERFDVRVYGKSWQDFGLKATLKTVAPRGYGLICSGAKILLGADITSEVEGYWSNRLWLTLGCGGFFLTRYVAGMEKYFENKKHLVWYHEERECMDLAEEYLAKPRDRRRIAQEGYRLVHEQHTFHHFVDRVTSLCSQGSV
jgi:spore maturation protein CgeB